MLKGLRQSMQVSGFRWTALIFILWREGKQAGARVGRHELAADRE